MVVLCVHVPQALYAALRKAAQEEGVTVSELVRYAVFAYLLQRRRLPALPPPPPPRRGRKRSAPFATTLTPYLLARLERAVEAGYFNSKAEAVRLALDMLLSRLEERLEARLLEVGYR